MFRKTVLAAALVASTLGLPSAAQAAGDANNALSALRYLNLSVLGNLQSTSHVEGRTYVGGALSGNGTAFYQKGNTLPAISAGDTRWSGLAALTVGGSVGGAFSTHHVENGGSVVVGGSASGFGFNGASQVQIGGNITDTAVNGAHISYGGAPAGNSNVTNLNGGTVTFSNAAVNFAAGTSTLAQDFAALSTALKTYGNASNLNLFQDVQNGFHGFDVVNKDAKGVAVFNIAASVLASNANVLQFKLNGADTVIVNVSGTTANLAANLNGIGIAEHVIWNFHEAGIGLGNATAITQSDSFYGSVLAPFANANNNSHNLNGSSVFKNFTQTGEVHIGTYSGRLSLSAVPEPSTWLTMIAGFGMVGVALRRRSQVSATA